MGFEFEYSNTGVQSTSTFRAAKKGFLCFLKIFFLPGFVQSNFDIVGELIYSIEDSITKEYNFIHNAFFFQCAWIYIQYPCGSVVYRYQIDSILKGYLQSSMN